MKFRFTNPVTIKRGQIPKRAAVFVACLTGTTALMVVLMSFFTPPNTSYTEGVKYLWKKGGTFFAAPSETTKSDIRKRNHEAMMLLAPSETCIEASQICAGVTVTARTASGTAEAGPFYGCLTTVPNPTWVYVKIATSGSLSFNVTLAPTADVDFAAWGPFTGPTCGAALNSAKLKACDYNPVNGGTAALGTVVAGEYYMILLTNFGNAVGDISLTINSGSTATVACPTPGGANSNLKLWFKADAGTSTTTNGVALSKWIDQGGQSKNITQTTAANQPLFVSNGINFNPAVNYDGVNDYLVNTTTGITGGDKTMFAVSIPNSLPVGTIGILGGGGSLNESQFGYQGGLFNTYENIGNTASATTPISMGVPVISTGIEASNALSFFNNGTANGTGSYTSTPATVRFTVGAHTIGAASAPTYKNYWPGYISEVILFDAALSALSREKIESYLGLKYGITLGHNTLNNVGTVVWDKTANATYHNNVTGIGRDDTQGFNQKQSKSINAGSLVTMGNATIAATNATNTNAFAIDNSFEIFGDDNAALAWQTTESPALRQRMGREWKVAETGTVGSVKIQVPDNSSVLATKLSAASVAVYLLVDADGDFSSGATSTTMTLNGTNWEANVDFTDGQFFTFATQIPTYPGGVVGAAVWLKADASVFSDAGTTQATSGGTAQQWNTQLGSIHATQITAGDRALYQDGATTQGINFNPVLQFVSNDEYHFSTNLGVSGTNPFTISAVTKQTAYGRFFGTLNSFAGNAFEMDVAPTTATWAGTANIATASGSQLDNIPHASISSRSGNTFSASVDGGGLISGTNTVSFGSAQAYDLGSAYNANSFFTGSVGEFIVFNTALSVADLLKVNSYLAIKYGMTLDQTTAQNYVNSTGTVIWDATTNATYKNNITGIGRDDNSALSQKQSKSANPTALVTVGNGNTISTTNILNTNSFSANNSFMLFADDNAALTWQTTESPASRQRIGREWKVAETGTVGTVKIQVPDNGSALATKLPAASGAVYLLVDADGDFSSGATSTTMTLNGTNWETNVDFTDGQYFTFATNIPLGPGGITSGLTLWLKADDGPDVFTEGSAITTWTNKVGFNHPTQATAANKPTYRISTQGINFNPVVQFNGTTNFLAGPSNYGVSGSNLFSTFAVANRASTGTADDIWGQTAPANNSAVFYIETSNLLGIGAHNINLKSGPTTVPAGNTLLLGGDRSAANMFQIYQSGAADGPAGAMSSFGGSFLSTNLNIGSRAINTYTFSGNIPEIILYGSLLSATDRQKVDSYLAIKYGLTLSKNYLSCTGTTIYPADGAGAVTFDNNIFGIGREDCQELHQKQSKSVNTNGIVTVGLKTIAATNIGNTNALADATYLVIGDDGVAAGASALSAATLASCAPASGLDALFNRKWKALETGVVDTTLVSVPVANLTGLTATQPIYFVTADDAAFTVNVKYQAMTTNGANREAFYNFNGTKYFTFAGTATASVYCTGSSYVRWSTAGWTTGSLTKNVTLNGGLTMNTTLTDPNSIILSGYPRLYNGLPLTYISSKLATNAVTWTSVFNQKVAGVSFSVYDIDNIGTLAEQVDVKGFNGATLVNPIFSKPLISSVTVSGTTVSGTVNNVPTYSPFAKINVSFNQVIDKVVITYKNNKNTTFKRGAAMLISDFSIFCPEPVVTPDLIALSKMAPTGNYNIGDTLTYTFKINNADCAAKAVNFSDVLPTGFTYVGNSYMSPISGGTINAYDGTNTLTITGLNVPVGITTFTADVVVAGTAGTTKNNQATVTVPTGTNTTILSDDPLQAGTSDPTPVVLAAPLPTAPLSITKAVSPSNIGRSGTVTFTYTFNNTSASAITTEFTDELQLDTASYKAASLTLGTGLTGAPNAYGGDATLSFASLSIPMGTSSLTVQVDMNNTSYGVYTNTATILPTSAAYRQLYINSNEVNWTVSQGISYAYGCLGAQVLGNFVANGAAGQTGTMTIPFDGSFTGAAVFTVTGTGFTGTLSTTIVAGQSSVTIPIVYDGTGTEGSRTLTVTTPQGSGTCATSATIQAACKANGGQIGSQ